MNDFKDIFGRETTESCDIFNSKWILYKVFDTIHAFSTGAYAFLCSRVLSVLAVRFLN